MLARMCREVARDFLLTMSMIWSFIQRAIHYDNEQLNRIADWPILKLQDVSTTRQEVVR